MSIQGSFRFSDHAAIEAHVDYLNQLSGQPLLDYTQRFFDSQRHPKLSEAILQGDVETVRVILSQQKVSDLAKNESLVAVAKSKLDPKSMVALATLLIEAGVSEYAKFEASQPIYTKYETETDALRRNDYILLFKLLRDTRQALMLATRVQDIVAIRLLLTGKQTDGSLKKDMEHVLRSAVDTRSVEIVREFVKHKIYPELKSKEAEEMNVRVLEDIVQDTSIESREDEVVVTLRRHSDYGEQKILEFLQNKVSKEVCEQIALLGIKNGIFYLTKLFPDGSYKEKLSAMPEDVHMALLAGDADALENLLKNGIDDYIKYSGLLFVVNSSLDISKKIVLVLHFIHAEYVHTKDFNYVAQVADQIAQNPCSQEEKNYHELLLALLA